MNMNIIGILLSVILGYLILGSLSVASELTVYMIFIVGCFKWVGLTLPNFSSKKTPRFSGYKDILFWLFSSLVLVIMGIILVHEAYPFFKQFFSFQWQFLAIILFYIIVKQLFDYLEIL